MTNYHNSTFRIKEGPRVYKPRKPIARKTPINRTVKRRETGVGVPKAIPVWVKAIPPSEAHGSGTLQKRLWRLVSDYVRLRDWHAFDGRCVATGVKLKHWSLGNAGHFKPYSKCNGLFKFDPSNIHLQAAISNKLGTMEDGALYSKELRRRYGENIEWEISYNNNATPLKIQTWEVIEKMRDIISLMAELPEKPAYYERVVKLMK